MNYKNPKFSLIFRIISLMLIQAFLALDIAWAAGGELSVANEAYESSNLAPEITLNSKEVLDTYLYFLKNSTNIPEAAQDTVPQTAKKSKQSAAMSRRTFFKMVVSGAAILTGIDWAVPVQASARDVTVDLRDLVVSFNNDVTEAELNKYVAIIESQGYKEFYTVEKNADQTIIRIQGLYPLNVEKLSDALNAQAKVKGLSRYFLITSSDSSWEKSLNYSSMQTFANKVADISSELGFGEIDSSELVGLYEGVTWVESKFNHWEIDILGRIRLLRSYTNAVGVTQVIESQAVKQIAEWILTHKGGLSRYSEIMNELERMILSDSEKVKEALKQNRKFTEETAKEKRLNVYDDFTAFNNANLNIEKEKQIIRKIHGKINNNPNLIGVNLYYALAVWEYLQKKDNLQARVTADIAQAMGQTARRLTRTRNKKQVKLIESGPGAYKPDDLEEASLQFQRDYFRLKVLEKIIGKKKINEIMQLDPNKRFDKLMRYLTQQMVTKTGNPRLGYSYLTLNWDRYRRLKLSKTKKNKYELSERPLSYFKNNPNGFSVSLAAAASYNAGTGSVDEALLNFGDTVDTNNIPLWIKHMIGANPRNVREPINYIRAFLEDKYNNTGKLSQEEQNIKNDLIAERYKRIYKVKDRLLENRKLVRKNGVTMYADYIRSDSFDHKLAALLARVIGSDYVDSFLRSHGMGKEWEKKIFSRTTPTFDMLASILSNENAPGYDDALSLQRYLDQKHFTASLAYLDERIEYFKQQEQTRSARIELTKQIAKEKELQKTMAFIKAWATRSAVGAASLAAAGAIAWIMRRRVKLGKKAVTPVMYKLPLKALGIFGLFAVRTVVAVVKLFVSTGSYIVSFLSRKKTPKRNRYKKNSSTRFWTIIIMPFIVFQFLSFFNADYTQAQTVNPVIGVTATQVSPLFDSLKNPVPKLTGQAKVVNWDAVRNFRRTYAYQSRQGGFKVISVDKIDGKNTIEVPAGGFAISREKDLYAPGFFGCVGTVWYHAKTKTAAIGHHYSEAPDTQAEVNQIVEFFKGIPLNEVVVTLVGASDNSNGVFTENLNSLLSKLREKQGININENKFDLFRPGEKAFYVDRETGNIYRVNQDAETSSIDTRDREEKHYFSIAKKVMYFTGLSAVVSIISTILTPGIAAAAAPGIISTGVGVGLILGLVLLGLSFIGIYAWVTLRRLQGSGQEQQNSETEVQNTKEQQDDGFEYSLRNREDWIEVLKNNGLQQANIDHVQRNVRAVEYFGEKENLTALEMEILKVSFWMHDLTKDTPIDKYKLRYLPEDTELSEIIQSLYERNLDDPKQAEQFLKEKSYEEDLIAKIKSVLNRNMKLAGTFRLLIHHLESAARAREILAELGYAENFIHKVESIIIRHMGPVMGKERMGFMEMTRTMNIGAIENGLVNSDLPLERNDKLMEYVDLLKRPFPVPITKLELIGRDIDLLDLAGDGVVKVVTFRQTLPDFFVDGRPEDIEASFDSAMQSAEDVSVNLGASTANNLINGMLARLENYKIHMQANGIWKLIALLDSSTKLDIFTKEYNGYMQENLLEYDLALKGERPLTPETLMKILQKRGEEQAATRLKRYTDDPMLERFWVFVLDFITRSKEKYGKVKQYNASQCNELLIAFDTLADYLPFVGNKEQIKRLSRIAIYMRDLGDFDESGDSALSAEGHRAKSKKIAEKFMRTFNEEFSGLEIEAVMYLIGKNQAAGKISDSFKQEAADDNRAYLLLSDFKVGRGWENVSGADRDANFIKKYMDKNFSHARIWIEDDLDLMMNVIWGGKVIAYGLDASADFPEQIPMMSRVFSLDELMLELMKKNEAVKRNPAPKTYIEQMSRNKENFVPFDNREMHQHGLAENMVGASI